MKKPLIISLLLLWIWIAITLSTDYYLVNGEQAIREAAAKRTPAAYQYHLREWKREPRIDGICLVWLLLPPVLALPVLRKFWRR